MEYKQATLNTTMKYGTDFRVSRYYQTYQKPFFFFFFSFFQVICGKTVHCSQLSKENQQLMTTQHYSIIPLNYIKQQTNPSTVVPDDKILSKVCLWSKEHKGWGVNLR